MKVMKVYTIRKLKKVYTARVVNFRRFKDGNLCEGEGEGERRGRS